MRGELGAEVEVVGEADEVAAAIELIGERLPDVVLVDVHMPDGGGQAVIEAVGRVHPEVRFLALSVSDAAEDVIGVIRAGARGYVTKTISGAELTDAIVRVADGDAVFSPRLAGFVLDAFAADPGRRRWRHPDLRPRARPAHPPRARGAAPHRPRLRLQRGGPAAVDLGQDGGEPRLGRPAQAAAVEPAPAHPLGLGAPPALRLRALGRLSLPGYGVAAPKNRSNRPSTPAPCSVIPPSTTRVWPVMNRARSEHKNTMTSATSSGSPTRPAGVVRP